MYFINNGDILWKSFFTQVPYTLEVILELEKKWFK